MDIDYVLQKSKYGKSNKVCVKIFKNTENGMCIGHEVKPSKIYVTKVHNEWNNSCDKNLFLSWNKNGVFHRDGGPAKIGFNYIKFKEQKKVTGSYHITYCKDGLTHREDGPAFTRGYFDISGDDFEKEFKRLFYAVLKGEASQLKAKSKWFLFNKMITGDNLKSLKKSLKIGKHKEFIGLIQLSDCESFAEAIGENRDNQYGDFSIEQRDRKLIINNYYAKY
jgi:hypothetical protein